MKKIVIIFSAVIISGCIPMRVVKDLPSDGACEKLATVNAYGASESEVRSKLERKAEEIGGNLLYFDPDQPFEVTLMHPVKSGESKINGVGVVYRCTYE